MPLPIRCNKQAKVKFNTTKIVPLSDFLCSSKNTAHGTSLTLRYISFCGVHKFRIAHNTVALPIPNAGKK